MILPVVAGVGSPDEGSAALEWAADEARVRRSPLVLVRAWRTDSVACWDDGPADPATTVSRRAARRSLRDAAALVHARHPTLRVSHSDVEGAPVDVLLHESQRAALTVLGSRHLSGTGAPVLGSVGSRVAAQAEGPVVVVAGPGKAPSGPGRVIVGLDAGGAATDVLDFGLAHAARHGLGLRAVLCRHPAVLPASMGALERPVPARLERWLTETLAPWRQRYPTVPVRWSVVRGHAVDGLVQESRSQHLLVVGGRGRPQARHARLAQLLGSVTQGVLHHAACPVAVIHPVEQERSPVPSGVRSAWG